jgi:hypothetical protein
LAQKRIKSKPGLFGVVYYYDEKGRCVGKSRPGLSGDTRVYTDNDGNYVGKSRPGFFAEEVYTDAEHNHITSYKGITRTHHYQNGKPIGYTKPGFFDSAYTDVEEDIAEEYEEETYEDLEIEEYDFIDENPQKNVVRNLQFAFLSIVICMIILCVYAIVRFN